MLAVARTLPKEGVPIEWIEGSALDLPFPAVVRLDLATLLRSSIRPSRTSSRSASNSSMVRDPATNTWLLVNPGGGPTPDKPSVTLSVPANPDSVSSFMNIRVADIQACYKLWRSRGAEFITEPKPKYGETRCYIRDPDGYIIEVGQSNPGVAYG
jgi:hypothetical protein